ncbi:uncharacterized protein LOC114559595 [Perca flavescens]|uniref:uncharacterized protein LOC114559595 n=1 Tax=Perca flavescens TaxID=8167 RepID=UPI00106E420E|nr:uncharacterized protein LOC114559595 [Perca flavescens]
MYLMYPGPYSTDIKLKYSKVFTNIGNAYNPATGFFTAPVNGVYYLQFTLKNLSPRDEGDEQTEQTTKQTTPDIWAEVRAVRDMVVELQVELRNMEARVKYSEGQVNQLKTELIVTKVHVEQLQRETSDLQTRLSSSESRIDQLERKNAVQEIRLTAIESKTRDLEEENADLQTRLSSSESRIDQLERKNAEKPKVAFYTALTEAGNVGPYNTDITLKYSKVFTNIGNAYNPATGFFTAPVNGVYYLQFTVCGSKKLYMAVFLYKNNQRIMYNHKVKEGGELDYFTNSVVLELKAGDEIHLDLPSDHAVFDDRNNYSTFSGSLLFPL